MAFRFSNAFNPEKLRQSLYARANNLDKNIVVAVEQAAKLIMDEAKANVPVDTHNLEEAIHITNRRTRKGNHAVDIEVSGSGFGSSNPRDVAAYAIEIEENYESYIPGPGTEAKRAANPGRYVGSHYMRRAVDDNKAAAIAMLREAIRKSM